MDAYTTVSAELAAELPSLKDKIGKSITSGELASARETAKEAKDKSAAPASSAAPRAPRVRAPRPSRAKGAAKKGGKK